MDAVKGLPAGRRKQIHNAGRVRASERERERERDNKREKRNGGKL